MNKLVEKIKKECIGAFKASTREDNPSFGVNYEETKRILVLCDPALHYSRTSLVPKPLKQLIKGKELGDSELIVIHYSLSEKALKKELDSMSEFEAWWISKNQNPERYPLSPDEYMKTFKQKFGNASCIRTNFWNYSLLVGSQQNMQEAMNYFKQTPQNTQAFLQALTGKREGKKPVKLYDLLNRPKKVKFK